MSSCQKMPCSTGRDADATWLKSQQAVRKGQAILQSGAEHTAAPRQKTCSLIAQHQAVHGFSNSLCSSLPTLYSFFRLTNGLLALLCQMYGSPVFTPRPRWSQITWQQQASGQQLHLKLHAPPWSCMDVKAIAALLDS